MLAQEVEVAGEPLELSISNDAWLGTITSQLLGFCTGDAEPVRVVPAGRWQSARSTGAYTLVGCTVAPGFEFADFEMLAQGYELS